MEPWMWIVGIVVLLIVGGLTARSMRPKLPEAPGSAVSSTAVSGGSVSGGSSSGAAGRAAGGVSGVASVPGDDEIDRLVAEGNKILAIKRLRERSPMSLREAKEAIDRWQPSTSSIGRATAAAAATDAFSPSALPIDVRAEIDRLVAAEQPISAIKLLREHSDLGLKAAKDAIDRWV
ncbi:ribosomal protein L7/L12 [Microbacterium resistens]|uniref:Ribosomal protein L7/L12 n=1 Tax=Microbacterium resistens TaxID=156977 RepID=A0ABU1SBC5_9MICO|nr:hypothetical protein [Microbacterium resistens]MDR6866856.1 ribosomal protein L7/L12 [Microbacterium resistens]